jgi:hypothetical protein
MSTILHDNFKRELKELLRKYDAEIEAWNDDGFARMAITFTPINSYEASELELGGWFPEGDDL